MDYPTGQIDIAPTVLGLLGLSYTAPFYGIDVLHQDGDPTRHPLFLNHNHDVGVLVGDELAVLGLNQSAGFFRYDRQQDTQAAIAADPRLLDLATAYYQSAYQLFIGHLYR